MMKNNCIVDVSIDYVEFLFKRWYSSCFYYMHIGHGLMDISYAHLA
jgi:hypothetical protein